MLHKYILYIFTPVLACLEIDSSTLTYIKHFQFVISWKVYSNHFCFKTLKILEIFVLSLTHFSFSISLSLFCCWMAKQKTMKLLMTDKHHWKWKHEYIYWPFARAVAPVVSYLCMPSHFFKFDLLVELTYWLFLNHNILIDDTIIPNLPIELYQMKTVLLIRNFKFRK